MDHPNQVPLTGASEFTVGNGNDLSVVTTVPNLTPNDTWTLSLRVAVNSKLSAASLWSLQSGPGSAAAAAIVSVTPAAQVAAGFGQLLFIRGSNLPNVVVFSQGGFEHSPQWTALAGSELAVVRLPLDLRPGAATVRLTDTTHTVTTSDFSITISDIPGTPVITAVTNFPGMTAITKVSPGQQIAIHAEGMDTSLATIEWTHPNQAPLTSASEFTVGNASDISVVTTVPNVTLNDTWILNLRVAVNSKLSAACLWSLQT